MVCSCTWACSVVLVATLVYFLILRKRTRFDPTKIRGKRVLVTGAASGIGEQVAYKYAELGAKLLITDLQAELLDKVANKCRQLGATLVHTVTGDMTDTAQRENLVAETERILGGLDHLMQIHGIMQYEWIKGTEQFHSHLRKMYEINFFSHADLTGRFLNLLEASQGSIGIISSVTSYVNGTGGACYGSTKSAINAYYKGLRQELRIRKTGVTVSIMVYGLINTDRAIEITKKIGSKFDVEKHGGKKEEAAEIMIKSVSTGQYETLYPTSTKVLIGIHKLFPSFIEDTVVNYTNKGRESYQFN